METVGTEGTTAGSPEGTSIPPVSATPEEKLLPAGTEVAKNPSSQKSMPVALPILKTTPEEDRELSAALEMPEFSSLVKPGGPITPPITKLPAWISGPLATMIPQSTRAEDALHMGNAVTAAQTPLDAGKGVDASEEPHDPVERSLREAGLKQSLPHGSAEPERVFAPENAEDGEDVQRIHTYAADMSQEIEKRGAALSTIITAEKARVPQAEESAAPEKGRHLAFRLGAGALITIGIGVIIAVIILIQSNMIGTVPVPESMIPINHRVSVVMDNQNPLAVSLADAERKTTTNLGEVTEIDITKGGAALSAEELLTDFGAPNVLARNAVAVMVGMHAYNKNQPFLIISISAYNSAFEGMLSWERTIGEGLGSFFAPDGIPIQAVVHPPDLIFTDRVSGNLDVRGSQATWPILYAFPRRDLLVITTNESTLREILTRLSLQKNANP